MYVAVIPNRSSPPAILLRESYREAGKTKNRTLANLSGWPAERIEQPFIEARLARRHLKNGALLLYDVTSTYLEGRCCELAQYGYSRDHRSDRPQIVIGLMCAADGCPVAVEVFEGNTADPVTLSAQIDKLKQRFHLQRVVMVGDRGLLTSARLEQTLRPAGLDWITALRAPAIKH